MKSGWLVQSDFIHTKYKVYRLKDALGNDQSDNQEVEGLYDTRDEAVERAKELNKQDAERFWKGCQ